MDETWQRAFVTTRRRWPHLHVGYADFSRHLKRIGADGGPVIHADDVYVCCACALGRPEARQTLLAEYRKDIDALVKHLALPEAASAARHELEQMLFEGVPPLVASYTGCVSLASWIRVTALRTLLMGHLRADLSAHPDLTDCHDMTEFCRWLDIMPAATALEADSSRMFRRAFAAAFDALPVRDQTMMRLHVARGVSVGALSKAYQLSESVVKQGIFQSRERLLSNLCDEGCASRAADLPHLQVPSNRQSKPAPGLHSSSVRCICEDASGSSTRG